MSYDDCQKQDKEKEDAEEEELLVCISFISLRLLLSSLETIKSAYMIFSCHLRAVGDVSNLY